MQTKHTFQIVNTEITPGFLNIYGIRKKALAYNNKKKKKKLQTFS